MPHHAIGRRGFLALAGAAGWAGIARAGAAPAPLRFAAINDLHLTDAASAKALEGAIDAINAEPDLAFAVAIGDVASWGKPGELDLAKALLARLRVPWRAVPGNHDVDPRPGADPLAAYTARFGPANWRFDAGDWTFLGLDSCDGVKSEVSVPGPRLEWLRAQAAALPPDRPIGLFVHHPLNPHSKAYRIGNADAVIDAFAGKRLRLAAAGHFHGNQDETRGGVLFTTTACCSVTRDNHDGTAAKGFRVYTCTPEAIDARFVPVALG